MKREEAIKILRDIHDKAPFSVRNALETLIPELAESEDEKIRKWIIDELKDSLHGIEAMYSGNYDNRNEQDKERQAYLNKALAYLEKQKEEADKRLERVELHCKEVQEFDKKIKALRKEWYGDEQKEQDECPEYCVRSHCMGCSIYEKQKERKPKRERKKPKESWLEKAKYELEHADELLIKRQEELREIRELKNKEQKPVGWREEDENIIDTIVSVLGQYIDYKAVSGTGSGYATPRYSKEIAWLNSLRPSWKPSEEQMEALRAAFTVGNLWNIPWAYSSLKELYEQLKKL